MGLTKIELRMAQKMYLYSMVLEDFKQYKLLGSTLHITRNGRDGERD